MIVEPTLPLPLPLRRYRLAAFAALVLAVGTSHVQPVAGPIAVAAALTLLRAGDLARTALAARRDAHGPRARDRVVVTAALPWLLVRSAAVTILLAPLLMVLAGIVVAAPALTLRGWHPLPPGVAFAAAYTALSCLGPGSRAPRRELQRAVAALARGPLTAAMGMLAVGAVAIAIVSLALVKGSAAWPVPGLHLHLPGLSAVRAGVRRWAP
jgi:hypothetical protein